MLIGQIMSAPLFYPILNLAVPVCVCVALQMALLGSAALRYPLSAGQLTVSVLLLLVLSAAARCSKPLGKIMQRYLK